jgi:hypothetical protein
LRKLGFLTIGLFDGADPRSGHESTLDIIALGERLGFDSAWVRQPAPDRRPQGPGRLLFSPDLVGSSAEIADRLYRHAAFCEIDEVAFALPFTFERNKYVQILTDIATGVGPTLGWSAASANDVT